MSDGGDAHLQSNRRSPVPGGRRRWPSLFTVVLASGVVLGLVLLLVGSPVRRPARARLAPSRHGLAPAQRLGRYPEGQRPDPGLPPAHATVQLASGPTLAIPRSFFGFSTEYWTLPVDETHIALYRRVLSQLHNPGDGRFVLRIGGVSSDHSFWQVAGHRVPEWAFAVTPQWISRTAQIVRQSDLRVIIDLNLVTATPALNAALAREAIAELPHGSIAAFEIGNEPDVYSRAVWGFRLGGLRTAAGLLPTALTSDDYAESFAADARALDVVAARIPLQGPALASPRRNLSWIARLLTVRQHRLNAISVHEYPYTACARSRARTFPTIGKLLSFQATSAMAAAVTPAVRLGRRAGLPVRVSEFNSVTCGGVPGVSNTFATALWAPSALFTLIRAGVSAADLHVRAYSINAPFRFGRRGLLARPLLYGLMLFTRMVRPGSRMVGVRVHAPPSAPLRVWAVSQGQHRLSVLLIDRAARAVKVNLQLPTRQAATVQRLLAPSARATWGETLAGQRLGADGRWHGRRRIETVASRHGHFTLTVGGMSASMMTVALPSHHRVRRPARRRR